MSEQNVNVDEVVEELSKPENKAELDKALNDAFNEATTADAKTAEAQPAENKTSEDLSQDQPGDKSGEAGDSEPKKTRYESLLEDRNVARTEAAQKQTEVETLTKRVEELSSVIEKFTGKGNDATDDVGTDEPLTKEAIDALVEQKLKEKIEASQSADATEKSISDQIQALENKKDTPDAKNYADDLKALMVKHPTISAYAAYRMLQGEGVIPTEGGSSNANKTGTGSRSRTNLLDSKKPDDMSTDEMTAYLRAQEKAGNLSGQI